MDRMAIAWAARVRSGAGWCRRRLAPAAVWMAASSGCSAPEGRLPDPSPESSNPELGSLELALITPEGVSLTEVNYEVFSAEGELVDGDRLDVGSEQTFSFSLVLPEDSGYELVVTAEGEYEDEHVPCEGRVRFNIAEDAMTQVDLDVVCTVQGRAVRPGTGGASVTASVSVEGGGECTVTSLTVGPLVVYRGEYISVRGSAKPTSATFTWSTSGNLEGEFELDSGDPSEGTFLCSSGDGEIVLTIDDEECVAESRVPVACAEPSVCGDSHIDIGEECDDGNTFDHDGCGSTCATERCGDGIVQRGETCDDGNAQGGDGCSATCTEEFCGNGVLEGFEECDDGDLTTGDGCSASCQIEACGDGIVQAALGEECDDGNHRKGDGCSEGCLFEDIDSDGVIDLLDQCPDSDATLVGVDGCTIEQRCPCDDDWDNSAQYVNCVANTLNGMFSAESIDADRRAEMQLAAAESDCGR